MIDGDRLEIVRIKCGFHDGLCLNSMDLSGSTSLWWRDLDVSKISYSNHHILVKIRDGGNGGPWYIYACEVYG